MTHSDILELIGRTPLVEVKNFEVLHPKDALTDLVRILKKSYTAIIMDQEHFYGVVTSIDLLNYLKRKRDV
jgi:hypothetical protein